MTIQTAAGARLYIGSNAAVDFDTLSDAAIAAAIDAQSPTEVNEVEDAGEIGDEIGIQTFTALKDGRVRKLKTTRDSGNAQMILGLDSADAGQIAMLAAAQDNGKNPYNFKLEFGDMPSTSGSTPTTLYFAAHVTTARIRIGQVDNVLRRLATLALDTKLVEIAAVEA